jgi:hypothetical protein
MDYSSRIHRLFHIITLIQGSAGITTKVLADKFDLTCCEGRPFRAPPSAAPLKPVRPQS